jgi:hypothetical protein
MKVQCPYRCDYCLNLKGETNHWWLRLPDAEQFRLMPWDQALADLDGYEHICSESCASKALSKWLSKSSGASTLAVQLPLSNDARAADAS